MDIFVIKTTHDIEENLLLEFQKKAISNKKTLYAHCLSYLMVDRILKSAYGINETEIEFIDKKPYLKNHGKFFSISHSNEYIALCFSDFECGIDIEHIKDRDYVSIAKRMGFSSSSLEEFYFDWTKYEAEYKLGNEAKNCKNFQIENYAVTAVSENQKEDFQIYVQNEI